MNTDSTTNTDSTNTNPTRIDKVALCFIVSYECGKLLKEKIWEEWIAENSDIINVYVHYRDKSILSPFLREHIIPEEFVFKTTYYHMVPAYMTTLAHAYVHDISNKWFCILTESCIPVLSPTKFREHFEMNKKKSIMKWTPATWNVDMHKRANLHRFAPKFHVWNEPWMTLSRLHVSACMHFINVRPDIYQLVCLGGLANESMFALILFDVDEISHIADENKHNLLNTSCSIQDWDRMDGPTHPYTFTSASDMEYIISKKNECPHAMFARKISDTFPDSCVYAICGMTEK